MARKILLADDSVTAQNMGRRILTDAGYEVITVNNGSAALKKIAELKPDLIVLDVYMPGYGGLEVCQRMKENRETARVPVLLTVGKLEPFKPDEARRVQADAFIVKPFEASELLTALTKLEDKIVPQPEPYKPGRFAKAIAAVEQIAPDGFGDSETGWKERLIIPHPAAKHVEPEPEPIATTKVERETKPVAAKAGFERPMPAGLPADITPEEIAAITAAAAKAALPPEEPKPVELPVSEPAAEPIVPAVETVQAVEVPEAVVEPEPVEEAPATFASAMQGDAVTETPQVEEVHTAPAVPDETAVEATNIQEAPVAEAKIETPESAPEPVVEAPPADEAVPAAANATDRVLTSDAEVMAALASLGSSSDAAPSKPTDSVFSTTSSAAELVAAASTFTGPRWIAEAVPLTMDEASFILELEMEKQYAAFAAADAVCAALAAGAGSPASYDDSAVAVAEPPATVSDEPTPAIVEEVAAPEPVQEVNAYREAESTPEIAAVSASDEPVSEKGEAFAAAAGATESASAVGSVASPEAAESNSTEPGEAQRESELAAAWANWKQIRESIMGSQTVVQISPPVEEVAAVTPVEEVQAEPAPQEQAVETPAAASSAPAEEAESDGGEDFSEIVDDMLAELKPKLMKEIAKKLKTDKKKRKS